MFSTSSRFKDEKSKEKEKDKAKDREIARSKGTVSSLAFVFNSYQVFTSRGEKHQSNYTFF